jgi:biopolymer transport protein ExbB/TolQ
VIQGGRLKEAHSISSRSDAAIGRIVTAGLERLQTPARREDLDAAMEEGLMEVIPRLEKRTHCIATFANVITLVGLLGTVIGLIKGFTAVAQVNPADKAEMLSASISIAMNNTAFALMVAIPFLLIHAYLQARTGEIVDGLEAARVSFLNQVQKLKTEGSASRSEARAEPRGESRNDGRHDARNENRGDGHDPYRTATHAPSSRDARDQREPAYASGREALAVR